MENKSYKVYWRISRKRIIFLTIPYHAKDDTSNYLPWGIVEGKNRQDAINNFLKFLKA